MIQGYILIDSVEMTEEEREVFIGRMRELTVSHKLIKSSTKDFYQILLVNSSNIDILLDELSLRNPEILGCWNKDGTEFGEILIKTYNEETESYDELIEGTPTYPYNKTKTETYLNDRLEDDIVVGKIHHIFAGFTVPMSYND